MNDAEIRTKRIGPVLKVGWDVVEGDRVQRDFLIAPGRPRVMGGLITRLSSFVHTPLLCNPLRITAEGDHY